MTEMAKNQAMGGSSRMNIPIENQPPASMARPQPNNESGVGVVNQAKDVASHMASQAKDLVTTQVAQRTEKSAGDLGDVAKALRQATTQLDGNIASPYVEKAAEQLEKVSQFLRTANAQELGHSVESFARREPLLFLGGAFALGILGARFLKSSAHRAESETPKSYSFAASRPTEPAVKDYWSNPGAGRP